MIASYLDVKDLKEVLCTCQELHRSVFKYELFREIDCRFSAGEVYRPDDSATLSYKGHRLALILSNVATLRCQVRRLIIQCESCSCCISTAETPSPRPHLCPELSGLFMASLVAVKELMLTSVHHGRLLEAVVSLPPNLEVLQLGEPAQRPNPQEHEARLHLSDLVPVLQHPTLKSLKIVVTSMTAEAEGSDEPPTQLPSGLVSKITSLQLSQTSIEPTVLADIWSHLGAPTVFKSTRNRANMPDDRYYYGSSEVKPGQIKLHQFGEALEQARNSVEVVEITYADEARWRNETAVLDFQAFPKLRSLRVDPSIIIGRKTCLAQHEGPRTSDHCQSPKALASRLPKSLEVLDLVIDLEQVLWEPNYQDELLKSLFLNATEFPSLREITVYNLRSLFDRVRCCCQSPQPASPRLCPEDPSLRNPEYDTRSPFEAPRARVDSVHMGKFQELRNSFRKVGVLLYFMEENLADDFDEPEEESEEEIEESEEESEEDSDPELEYIVNSSSSWIYGMPHGHWRVVRHQR